MTEHDQLPLPDYDHLPVEGLTSRIRTLDAAGLETVLEYERAHANRLQVVTVMENRLSARTRSSTSASAFSVLCVTSAQTVA